MEQLSFTLQPQHRFYTVSELTLTLKDLVNREFFDIHVAGEISGLKFAASGHAYFTIKDDGAQLRCAIYRSALRYLKFKPVDGLAVIARGYVDVWEARGDFQLIVNSLEPRGHGALQLAFDQLKKKLEQEGLFAAERKKPLPRFPHRIGIVTSPTGAVIQDLLTILKRRFPAIHVRLFPTLVQGEGSVRGICDGLSHFNRAAWAEVVIVARGGGSLEDLWTFNEEEVARAIAASQVPVISAVGHETDFTIADFVADLRAPTPSAAAEMVVPSALDLLDRLAQSERAALRSVRYLLARAARRIQENGVDRAATTLHRRIGRYQQALDDKEGRMRNALSQTFDQVRRGERQAERRLLQQDPRLRLSQAKQRLERAGRELRVKTLEQFGAWRRRLDPTAAQLGALSPLRILERGYAIVMNESGLAVTHPAAAPAGSQLNIRLAHGRLGAVVSDSDPGSTESGG